MIDSDSITGRKLINQYEVIEEIGRGVHGKVKLARNLETGENVAIKIIPRYSKRRRLGKVMAMSPQEKTMREIAILKKMRHPNVVSLLEIIDDPELEKNLPNSRTRGARRGCLEEKGITTHLPP